jgi:HK97 family phage portal protein
MAFWNRLMGVVTGAAWRQPGQQSGAPGTYNQRAATPVSLDTALQLSAVWACAKLITESISSLPVNVYKKDRAGIKTLTADHPLARLLNGKMNRWQTRQEFFETLTYQLVLMGNNYSVIQRNDKKEIIALVPMMTPQMEVALHESGAVIYTYQDGNHIKAYSDETIWHNKIFGNGIVGLSPLGYARNSIGIAQAAEESVGKIYRNGGKPSGLLTIDKVLTPEQRQSVRKSFAELAEGTEDRLFVLEAGMNYHQVSLSPQDIELLASRKFQIEDICRFFGVPSVLVNDTSGSTSWGSGVQQIVQGFYKLGLRPYLERYEASMNARLLTAEERQDYEIEFDFNALLSPELSERMKTGKEGVTGGLITPNEWRAKEGMQPLKGGENLYLQQQMTPVDQLKDVPRGSISNDQKPT